MHAKSIDLTSITRDVDILQSLSHPNIIRCVEVFSSLNTVQLVMEYIPGKDLFDYIQEECGGNHRGPSGGISEVLTQSIVHQVLSAVNYMHCQGIIHRDIKAENVWIANTCLYGSMHPFSFPTVKLLDFGLAERVNREGRSLSGYAGSKYYAAPEVFRCRSEEAPVSFKTLSYGSKADCWSIGILLFAMLYAEYPVFGADGDEDADFLGEDYYLHCTEGIDQSISDAARDLLLRLLVLEERDRASAAEALEHVWLRR